MAQSPAKVSDRRVADLLAFENAATRRLVRALRRAVHSAAPSATEAIKFHCLCYYDPAAWFGAIGGNICMIEAKRGRVLLSFIQGAALDDPHGWLRGRAKFKRFVPIASEKQAADPRLRKLIRAAVRRAARVRDSAQDV